MFDDINKNLGILQEECAEVIVIASKALRFGLENCHPDNNLRIPNCELLEKEMGDVLAMIEIVAGNDIGITLNGVTKARDRKLEKLKRFYSQEKHDSEIT